LDNEYLQEGWMTKRDPVREPETKESTRREPPPITPTPPLKDPPPDVPPQEDPDGVDSPMKVAMQWKACRLGHPRGQLFNFCSPYGSQKIIALLQSLMAVA